MTTTLQDTRTARTSRLRCDWSDWVGYAAATWAATYGVVALLWTLTGRGFPFGEGDPDNDLALLRDLPTSQGAPMFAAVLLGTAVVCLGIAQGGTEVDARDPSRRMLLAFGWAVAAFLVVVVPTVDVLAFLGYLPMLVAGAPFGWPPVDIADVLTWPLLNQAMALVGGVLVAATVLAWQRRTRGACASCGRSDSTPRSGPRWDRWAVAVAVVVPLIYAGTRFAWLLGIPLGLDAATLRDLRDSGGVWAGAGLAAFAVVGAILTLGLIQRWGAVFPRWLPGLRGRRIPTRAAIVPATLVSIAVTSGGLGTLAGAGELIDGFDAEPWLLIPHLLWPVWGVTLGMATYAYWLRRRGQCHRCGRS
jgi:hypothetical protein